MNIALLLQRSILNKIGVVDYGVGQVAPGVFLVVTTDHPRLREALILRDMGTGPYYTLLRPYHLCSIEVPLTCAMLVIRGKSNMAPLDRLASEVFAVAKRDLRPGEVLDSIGGATFYGLIDTYETAKQEGLLPIGLAKGAVLIRSVARDIPITYHDVELFEPSTVLNLRRLQDACMDGILSGDELLGRIDQLEE
jgi:predicted homoserine dehydrogenase-like protein